MEILLTKIMRRKNIWQGEMATKTSRGKGELVRSMLNKLFLKCLQDIQVKMVSREL